MHTEKTTTGSSAKKRRQFPLSVLVAVMIAIPLAAGTAGWMGMIEKLEDQKDKIRALSDARGDGRTVYNYVCDDGVRKSFKWKEFVDPLSGDRSVVYMGPCKGVSFDYGTGD